MKLSSREQLLKEASSELKRIRKEISNDTLSEGKRRYKLGYNIGKSKYVISFHDGESKHKDGSDFFDVILFQDKKKFDAAIKDLERVGYVAESFGSKMNESDEREKKFWTNITAELDKKTKSKKFTNTSDYNFVAKELQTGFGGKLSQPTAMSIATSYGDYRTGKMTMDQFIEDTIKRMSKLRK